MSKESGTEQSGAPGWLIGCSVFLLLGMILVTIGICLHISNTNFKKNAVEIQGKITAIDKYRKEDGSLAVSVYVTITVDGVKYESRINESDGDMYVGQPITVFYDRDNPQVFRTCNPFFPVAIGLFGAAFLLIAVSPGIVALLKLVAMKRFSAIALLRKDSSNHFTEKSEVLNHAARTLNQKGQPWRVTVQGNDIVACWTYDSVHTHGKPEKQLYAFKVTLNDTGRWWEDLDSMTQTSDYFAYVGSFYGKTYQKSVEYEVIRNRKTGKLGLKKSMSMDTAKIKRAVRRYLRDNGYKKMRLFG